MRTHLEADTAFHVDPLGNDAGDGSEGDPWKTLQHASDFIQRSIDIGGRECIVQAAPGIYDKVQVIGPYVGGMVYFKGDEEDPENCVIEGHNTTGVLYAYRGAAFKVGGFHIYGPNVQFGLNVTNLSQVYPDGKMSYGHVDAAQIHTASNGVIRPSADWIVAQGSDRHIYSDVGGVFRPNGSQINVQILGTKSFGVAFVHADDGGIVRLFGNSMSFSGDALGKRFRADDGGVISTGKPASWLPGNQAGVESNKGSYS